MAFDYLSVSRDAKTVKGEQYGYLTGVLYLAPNTLSGFNTCIKATEGCIAGCLFYAGRGIYTKVQNARIKKTLKFFNERQTFMNGLVDDINKLIRKAKRENLIPVVRLNGTSDIVWEKVSFEYNGIYYKNIMSMFKDIVFYDYTKIPGRKISAYSNYRLTFSLSESNDSDALKALDNGMNVAVVVDIKRKVAMPDSFSGFKAIDGDISDLRFLEPSGSIILLRAKGKARQNGNDFVKSLDYQIGERV